MLVRLIVSLVCAVFGGLTISVSTCHWQHRPGWVEGVCRSHVELIWLLSVPVLFGLVYITMAKRARAFRRYIAAVLLSMYGIYGLVHAVQTREWWVWVVSLCALAAAFGVVARKRWAYALVWALALVYAAQWGYSVYRAAAAGYFQQYPLGEMVLSLLPGTVYLLMAGYCCYAVSQREVKGLGSR
jgi:hypothetical protein